MHKQDGMRVVSVCDSMGKVKLRRQQGALRARVTLCLVLVVQGLQAGRRTSHSTSTTGCHCHWQQTSASWGNSEGICALPLLQSPTTRKRDASAATPSNMLAPKFVFFSNIRNKVLSSVELFLYYYAFLVLFLYS